MTMPYQRRQGSIGAVRAALLLCAIAGLAASPVLASASDAYRALGLKPQEVLSGTVMNSRVVPGSEGKQVVCVVTYLTGSREKADAVNVKLGVLELREGQLQPLYVRDFGAERGGYVGEGELQLVDLDLDSVNEIIVSYETYADPLVEQRLGEVLSHDRTRFELLWSGPLEYDATRAARSIPVERRDRYRREIDLANTLRTRGVTLFLHKKVIAVAGEKLPEPQVVQETFVLRPAPG